MKLKNKYIALAAVGALTLASCNDTLDVSSPSQMDQSMAYSSTEFATNAINGVYVLFCEDPYTSRMCGVWMQNTDVEAEVPQAGVPASDRRAVWSLQAPAITGFNDVYNAWNNNLQAIERANQVRAGIDNSSIGKQDEMQQIKGEATCLKAFRYYLMCGLWGDVPYYDDAAKWGDVIDKPRTDKNVIYSRCLQQLVDIEPNMKWSDVNTGGIERMSRDFAIGLIARLALFRAGYGLTVDGTMKRADDYLDVTADSLTVTYKNLSGATVTASSHNDYVQMAKDYCQKIIQLKPRELNPDFYTAFQNEMNYTVVNNSEVLAEVAFVQNYGGDVGWSIGVTNSGCSNGNTTIQVGLTPSYYMSFADGDYRREITCANYDHNADTVRAAAATSIKVGKWDRSLAAKELGKDSSKGTGINFPLMRWSDILLMLAEAENELNGPTAIAKDALMKVRARAFAGANNYAEQVTNYVNNLGSKEAFFNAIVNERAWEFGGEGLRKFDLVRWNLYAQKIEQAMRTMLCWGINNYYADIEKDDAALASILKEYPEVRNYANWANKLWYMKTGKNNTRTDIKWYNTKYQADLDDAALTGDGWSSVNWGSQLIKRTRTYSYKGTDYGTSGTKKEEKDPVTEEVKVTYDLGTAPNNITFTIIKGKEPSGVTRTDKYQASDYATRLYRGYSNGALKGNGIVPYILPIGITTLNASSVLNNDGYCFNSTQMGEGINVDVATIITENW